MSFRCKITIHSQTHITSNEKKKLPIWFNFEHFKIVIN